MRQIKILKTHTNPHGRVVRGRVVGRAQGWSAADMDAAVGAGLAAWVTPDPEPEPVPDGEG